MVGAVLSKTIAKLGISILLTLPAWVGNVPNVKNRIQPKQIPLVDYFETQDGCEVFIKYEGQVRYFFVKDYEIKEGNVDALVIQQRKKDYLIIIPKQQR